MIAKWKQLKSYMDSKSMHERTKFNISKSQAQMILDLKKDELEKMPYLAMLDIEKPEVKQLAKKDPSIVKVIGRQGGSFRTSMIRKRANEEVKEDAPTVSIAKGGVDFNPTGLSKKKKKDLDGRTSAYKLHRRKLEAQREKRKKLKSTICGSFREEFIQEDNIDTLTKIKDKKGAMNLKFTDGQVKVDLQTANMILQYFPKIKNQNTARKMFQIINKGKKSQFIRLVDVMWKGIK